MSSWLKGFFSKAKQEDNAVLGMSLTPDSAACCIVRWEGDQPRIVEQFTLSQSFQSPLEALESLLSNHSLPALPLFITLGYEYYSLLLVDAPEVPASELKEAVGWKVKDLISQPLEDVIVDAFLLPDDAYRGRMKMTYVAVVDKKNIAAMVKACEKQNCCLLGIGINELSMAALTTLSTQPGRGTAVLYLNEKGGTINLIENDCLYLSRSIELELGRDTEISSEDSFDKVDSLALDIQRSLDYYESQIGKAGVSQLLLVSGSEGIHQWCDLLKERLQIPVALASLPMGEVADEIENIQLAGMIAPAFGAALRRLG